MNAGFLDVLHDAGDERILAVGEAIDVDFGGIRQIAVDQQRALFGNCKLARPIEIARKARDVAIELPAIAHDFHGAAAEHV